MIVPKMYINCILNELSNKSSPLEVKYPPIGKLFSVKSGETCSIEILSEFDYDKMRKGFLRYEMKGSVPDREIPSRGDFRTCLYSAGIIQSESQVELEEIIEDGNSRNLLKGKKPLFIGYDTNALSDRINGKVETLISRKSRDEKPRIGYCLSEAVGTELQSNLDIKYNASDLEKLKLPCMVDFTQNFLNQPPKSSRMAYLGAVEFKRIQANPNCELIAAEGKGDEIIVNSYKGYEKNHDVELLLITGDNNFTSRAQSKRIRTLLMKRPGPLNTSEPVECKYKDLSELIFCAAIVFGYIKLESVEIYGIWRGKSVEDWDAERVNIEIKDSGIKERVQRDLQIVEAAEKRVVE